MVLLTYGYSEGENLADLRANAIVDTFYGHPLRAVRFDGGNSAESEKLTTCSCRSVPGGKALRLVALACQQCFFALVASACVRPWTPQITRTDFLILDAATSGDPPLGACCTMTEQEFLKLAQQGFTRILLVEQTLS